MTEQVPNAPMHLSRITLANLLKERGWYPKSPDASVFVNEKNPVKILVIADDEKPAAGEADWTGKTVDTLRLEAEGILLSVADFEMTEEGVRKALEAATTLVSVA